MGVPIGTRIGHPIGACSEGTLLACRSLSGPNHLASSLALAPTEVSLQELAAVVTTRSTAEPCLEEAKGETGLDQGQVRHWPSRYRHLTLPCQPMPGWPRSTIRLRGKNGCHPV